MDRGGSIVNKNQTMLAVGLEVGPGAVFQTFGIGHLYAGKVGMGLGLMIGYWVLQAINLALTPFLIGYLTGPLTWLAFMVFAPTNLLGEVKR
jgi:TM2 domain-containing membrane protein YozV